MKILNSFFASLLTIALLAACGGNNQEIAKEDALKDEIFAIHDAVMPRMSEIVALKGELLELSTDSTKAQTAKAAISQLEHAEDGMMDWMNKFQQPDKLRESKKHEEIMSYLGEELERITKVRDDMTNGIETAKRMLANESKAE